MIVHIVSKKGPEWSIILSVHNTVAGAKREAKMAAEALHNSKSVIDKLSHISIEVHEVQK